MLYAACFLELRCCDRLCLLLGWFEGVGGFGDALEEWFALEIKKDGGLLDLAALEDALDDLVAV